MSISEGKVASTESVEMERNFAVVNNLDNCGARAEDYQNRPNVEGLSTGSRSSETGITHILQAIWDQLKRPSQESFNRSSHPDENARLLLRNDEGEEDHCEDEDDEDDNLESFFIASKFVASPIRARFMTKPHKNIF